MARVRALIVLVVAVALGGAFAFFTYRYIQQIQTPVAVAPEKAPTAPVVVAAASLALGAEVRPDDVRVIQWPAESVPPGAIADPEKVVGRGLIEGVVESELMLEAKMAPRDAGAGLPPAIPPGMRALSVRVNEVIGVAGYVLPGTRVDVVVTISPGNAREVTTKIVLTNVLVLAAGTKIERDLENNQPISVTVVTLLVNPAEAERLTLATMEGRIQLALRNPLDQAAPATPGIRPAALIAGGGGGGAPRAVVAAAPRTSPPPPAPPRPPAPPNTIEVIRGDRRVRETVPRAFLPADQSAAPADADPSPSEDEPPADAPPVPAPPVTAPPVATPRPDAPGSAAPVAVVSQAPASQE